MWSRTSALAGLGASGELVNSSAVGPVVQSGPARGPVKAEIAGSNPVGTARKEFLRRQRRGGRVVEGGRLEND